MKIRNEYTCPLELTHDITKGKWKPIILWQLRNERKSLSQLERDIKGIKTFYWHTNTSSMRVAQYQENPKACIYFCDKRFFRGVMLKGTIEVLEDSASKEMIWQDSYTMYYSAGVTDSDYCILKFTASIGRYYANFSSQDFDIL